MAKIEQASLLSKSPTPCLQFHGGCGYIENSARTAYRYQRLPASASGATEFCVTTISKLRGFLSEAGA